MPLAESEVAAPGGRQHHVGPQRQHAGDLGREVSGAEARKQSWDIFRTAMNTLKPGVKVSAELFPRFGATDFSTGTTSGRSASTRVISVEKSVAPKRGNSSAETFTPDAGDPGGAALPPEGQARLQVDRGDQPGLRLGPRFLGLGREVSGAEARKQLGRDLHPGLQGVHRGAEDVPAMNTLKPGVKVSAELFPRFGATDFSTEITRVLALRPRRSPG
jgi:hypothetical protein